MSAAEIVNIQTSLQARPLSGASFSVPLLGTELTTEQNGEWDTIYGPDDLVIDVNVTNWRSVLSGLGVSTSDAVYDAVRTLFTPQSGAPVPFLGKLARRTAYTALRRTVTIAGTTNGVFTIEIQGVEVASFTASGSTATQIRDGLLADLQALGASPVIIGGIPIAYASSGANAITLDAAVAGSTFTSAVDHSVTAAANITIATTTPSVGILDDFQAWLAEDAGWYAIALLQRDPALYQTLALDVETTGQAGDPGKILVCQDNDPTTNTATTTDLAALLRSREFARCPVVYEPSNTVFADVALLSRMLPKDPGAASWANQPLTSATGAEYASTANLRAKFATWVESFPATQGGFSMTQGGRVPAGFTIKNIHGRDWLNNRILISMLQLLRDNDVVDFEELGISQCEAALEAPLREAVDKRFLVSYQIFSPDPASISANQKATGRLPLLSWSAVPRDAIEGFDLIQGSISN